MVLAKGREKTCHAAPQLFALSTAIGRKGENITCVTLHSSNRSNVGKKAASFMAIYTQQKKGGKREEKGVR